MKLSYLEDLLYTRRFTVNMSKQVRQYLLLGGVFLAGFVTMHILHISGHFGMGNY